MGFGVYTIFRGEYKNDIYSKMSQNFLVLKFTQNRAKLLVRIKYTFFCMDGTVAPRSVNQHFLWSYCSAVILFSILCSTIGLFFQFVLKKNSGINSILPNKRVGFKANSSLVYWVYQSLSYEKT